MGKAGILTINTNRFDDAVWQSETGFTQKNYNTWLHGASSTLQNIYDTLDGIDVISPEQLYLLGDVINLLDNIEIKTQQV